MKKTASNVNVDGTRLSEICQQLADALEELADTLESIDGKSAGLGAEYRGEILHFKRSDGIDIFVVKGETRDKMRAQLPPECRPV